METCMWCKGKFPRFEGPTHKYIESTPGCWHIFGLVLAREYENYSEFSGIHGLTVDAYATQHPGQPSKKSVQSVYAHLVRMYYVFEEGLTSRSERIEKMKRFVESKPDLKWLNPPELATVLTIADVFKTESSEKHRECVYQWAKSVWEVWKGKYKSDIYQFIQS
ncbi:DUF5946 family protein [Acidobacteriota bacterium]